jgi:DNA repair protein RecN (Recombination protein N)
MLTSLEVRDILIIDRLSLSFRSGLNVLTGETGAGKSILLDALGMVLGWRGRGDLVRQGAARGEVVAAFEVPPGHAAHAVLQAAGMQSDPAEDLILRRVVTVDGRKQGFVNDRRVSGEVLRDLGEVLVELHGQHDDRGLLNPRGHRVLLDTFAGADLAPLRAAWRSQSQAREALRTAQDALARAAADEDYLRHAVAELNKLMPEPGEEAALDTRRRTMQAAEKVRADVAKALSAIGEVAAATLREAARLLEEASQKFDHALDVPLAALSRAQAELGEAEDGVVNVLRALDFSPSELDQVEERLFAIRGLARKYGVLADDLGGLAENLRGRLEAIDLGSAGLDKLGKAVTLSEASYAQEAARMSAQRREAARRLDRAMALELAPLKMERASFLTEVSRGEPGPEGTDAVTFCVATNPGAPAGPLNKIASGGELSRFLLALKVCLTGETPGLTMIFDEIDRGVGGATADAVGRRLRALAERAQVLVVTHSPQVAAFGAAHWRVEKQQTDKETLSTVTALDATDRIEEIARMLAGDRITDAARDAARALMRA